MHRSVTCYRSGVFAPKLRRGGFDNARSRLFSVMRAFVLPPALYRCRFDSGFDSLFGDSLARCRARMRHRPKSPLGARSILTDIVACQHRFLPALFLAGTVSCRHLSFGVVEQLVPTFIAYRRWFRCVVVFGCKLHPGGLTQGSRAAPVVCQMLTSRRLCDASSIRSRSRTGCAVE